MAWPTARSCWLYQRNRSMFRKKRKNWAIKSIWWRYVCHQECSGICSCYFSFLKKPETKTEAPTEAAQVEPAIPPPSDPIPELRSDDRPSPSSSPAEILSPVSASVSRQSDSNNNLLSMFLFLCCMILSFLLLRRLFLTFGANRSFPPPSTDPFHDDFWTNSSLFNRTNLHTHIYPCINTRHWKGTGLLKWHRFSSLSLVCVSYTNP